MIVNILSNLTGSFINSALVILGSLAGIFFGKKISDKLSNAIMGGLGLCVVYIGISGCLKGSHTLVLVISTVLGIVLGELMHLHEATEKLGFALQKRFSRDKDSENSKNSFAEGFLTASLLFCIGSMTVLGSIEAGIGSSFSRHTTLIVKSVIDFVSAMIFASQFGIGVTFSALFVLIFQGSITVIATFAGGFLSPAVIAEMTCVGSLILIGTGTNMLGITKIKTVNFIPGIFIAPAITAIAEALGFLQYI